MSPRAARRRGSKSQRGRTSPLAVVPERTTNVRRSMVGMFALLGSLSTPLASQSAFSLGFASTLGNHWQLTGGEFGLLSHIGAGPLQYAGASLRLTGSDVAAIFGGT